MKHVGPKLETAHLQVGNVPDGRWLRRVGDEVLGTIGAVLIDEATLTALPEHDNALFDIANDGHLLLPATLPVGWACRVAVSNQGAGYLSGVGAALDCQGLNWMLKTVFAWRATLVVMKVDATTFRVFGEVWPSEVLDASLVASGGGGAASSHTITIPSLPLGTEGGQVLIVRTGSTSTTHAITNDSSPIPFAQVATRDSTGRTTVFARPIYSAGVDDTVTLSLGASRTAAWVAIAVPDAFVSETLADWVSAVFAGSNTLNPPSAALSDESFAFRLTAASTRRTDNTLTAPTDTTLLASGQSAASSSSNNDARVSLAADPYANGGAFDPAAFGSTGTTNTPHAVTILVRAAYADFDPYAPQWSELQGVPDDNQALRERLASVRVVSVPQTTYPLGYYGDGDAGRFLAFTSASAVTVTVPTNASEPFPIGTVIAIAQLGTGTVTVVGATGVTINGVTPGNQALSARYATANLTKLDTNTWLLSN